MSRKSKLSRVRVSLYQFMQKFDTEEKAMRYIVNRADGLQREDVPVAVLSSMLVR